MCTFTARNDLDMHDWILLLDPFGWPERPAAYQYARDYVLDGNHPTEYGALEGAIWDAKEVL